MDDRPSAGVNYWSIIGWVVTLLALFFVGRWLLQLDRNIWTSLRHLRVGWLIAAIAVFQIWFLMRFAAWEMIVKRHGSESQRHVTLRNWTLSELARYVPGNVWSFAAKYRSSVSTGSTRIAAVQALAIEALSQLTGAGLAAALFYNAQGLWWVALLIIGLYPILIPTALSIVSRWKRWGAAPKISMTESLGLLLWYFLVWIVFGLATAMIYHGFPNAPVLSWVWLAGVNIAAWLIGYISIVTPMGLGVREVAFVTLSAGNIVSTLASLVSIVTRLWFVLSELIFLLLVTLWSMMKHRQPA